MGMNEKYADPKYDYDANNQVHHIWFYIQLSYYMGRGNSLFSKFFP